MRLLQSLLRRLRSFLKRDAGNIDLSDELQYHLEREAEENIAAGMSPEEALAAARASFGSVASATEAAYEARGVALIDDLAQDLRYGLRAFVRHRSFTAVTVLTLALGIGACTAIFSLVNAVLLRSLPYGDSGTLVYLFTPNPIFHLPVEVFGPANADFFDLKRLSHSYAGMTLFDQAVYNLGVGDHLERASAAKVDGGFFSTLQSAPEFGRVIGAGDQQPGHDSVVVISHALWQNVFAGRSDVLGQNLRLDGMDYQVIGVMPSDFGYPHRSDLVYGNGHIDTTDLWLPSQLTPQQKASREVASGYVIARLKPGVTVREAQAEMSSLMQQLDKLHAADLRGWGAYVKPFRDSALGPVRPLMLLLLGVVAFVLLIACGNAANLLLARAASRTHELGVRATLGARRSRLLRQMLTESLMLSVAAGAVGVGLAWLFLHALLKLDPGDIPRMHEATLDLRVMAFLVAITVLTSVLFGILPSLSATRINLSEFLKSAGTRGIMGDRKRLRNGLAVVQVALVVVLLIGAGLLLRSYARVLAVPTGFSASTITVNVPLTSQYNTGQKRQDFFHSLLDRLSAIRGVQSAGFVNYLPLTNSESITQFEAQGYPNQTDQWVEGRDITPGYLSAMQVPLIAGRNFTDDDGPGHPDVVLINQTFAMKYFAGRNPIGLGIRTSPKDKWIPVIGVVGDVRYESLETPAPAQMYAPFWRLNTDGSVPSSTYLVVRSVLPQSAVVSQIRAVVRALDPSLAIADIHTMSQLETQAVARRRFQTTLLTVFSAIAMLLAVVGVYGLLAYSVRQRTGEIGLRMALGSSKIGIVRLVLNEGLSLLAIGMLIGLAAACALSRLLTGFLYGVPVFDPVTFIVVPALLLVATLAACLVPSIRASAIDPMVALRHE